jgi:hypothetical protein
MNDKLTAFAAIKVFYDSGDDLIQIFGNLILLTVKENEKYSSDEVKKTLSSKIGIDIPNDVLHTIFKRLKKGEWIDYKNISATNLKSIFLTDVGKVAQAKIKSSYEDANREKNALLNSIQLFAKGKGQTYDSKTIGEKFEEFISKNSDDAVASLGHNNASSAVLADKSISIILDYFIETEKSDPENFKRLKAILYGKIVSSVFLKRRFGNDSKIEKLDVYLDTNIVFSMLGFHEDFFNISVREVVDLIKKAGGRLKIFSFTKDEINAKLRGYLREFGYYSSFVAVSSIYYVLKRKQYSKLQIMSLIENIEEKLLELDISIDYSFDIDDLVEDNSDQFSALSQFKSYSPTNSVRHDLAAMCAIKKIRGNTVFNWEKSKSIFLTGDWALTRYDFEKNHKNNYTFPEVVFRSDMASMLWIKGQTGSDNAFVHNFLASYMRDKVVSKKLWDKFIEEIKTRLSEGKISEADIEDIISYSETEKILLANGERGIRTLLDDHKIDERRKNVDKQISENKKNEEALERQAEQLEKIMIGITNDCQSSWNKRIRNGVWLIVLALGILFTYVSFRFGFKTIEGMVALLALLPIIAVAISLTAKKEFRLVDSLIKYRNNFESKMVTKCIVEKKRAYGIDDSNHLCPPPKSSN